MNTCGNGSDNPGGRPERPFRVGQDELERALRETLSRRVDAARPIVADPAGLAIRQANRMHRRRTMAGVALAAVATAVVTTGMAQLQDQPGRRGTPTIVLGDPPVATSGAPPAPARTGVVDEARPGVDLVVGSALFPAQGGRIDLGGIGPVERAVRLAGEGWLLLGGPTASGRTVWSVAEDGTSRVVLAGVDTVVVTADGRQVAWRKGGELFAAGIIAQQVIASVRTPVPARAEPVGWVGDAVLVRPDRRRPGLTLWRPGAVPFRADGDSPVLDVYGAMPDGRVVARADTGATRPCLAVVDPTRELTPVSTACELELAADGAGGISADGRWLLVNGREPGRPGTPTSAYLVDLTRAFTPTPDSRPAGPTVAGAVAWASPQTAVWVDDRGGLVEARVDRVLAGNRAGAAAVPGAVPHGQRPVPVTGGTA